jgi:NitT/TauT family transport system substrate-binding protein
MPTLMRRPLHLLALLLPSLLLAACGSEDASEVGEEDGSEQAAELVRLRVAAIPGLGSGALPTNVAYEMGFFEEEGLEIELTHTYDGRPLLVGGQVDMISDGADAGVIAAAQGSDVIAIAPIAMLAADGLMVLPEIDSVDDLKGKTLRVSGAGSTDEYLIQTFLAARGIPADEVEWVSVESDGAAITQMESRRIHGGMFGMDMFHKVAEGELDYNLLVQPEEFGPFPWNLLQTTRTFAEKNHDAVVRYVRAMRRTIDFVRDPANEEAVVDAWAASQDAVERDEVQAAYEVFAGMDWAMYSSDPLTPDQVRPVIDSLLYFGFSDAEIDAVDLSEFIDMTYVEEASEG